MTVRPGYRRDIEMRPSWRSQALNAVLRLALGKPLTHESDIIALRRQYERLDARQIRVGPEIERTPVECGGVPGEWIVVPETRVARVLLYLHGGSFAFRFPNTHAALAARLCRQLRARALLPDYRLVPGVPFPGRAGRLPRRVPRLARARHRPCEHRAGWRFGRRQSGPRHASPGTRRRRANAGLRGAALAGRRLHDGQSEHGNLRRAGSDDPAGEPARAPAARRTVAASVHAPGRLAACSPSSAASRRSSSRRAAPRCCATRRFAPPRRAHQAGVDVELRAVARGRPRVPDRGIPARGGAGRQSTSRASCACAPAGWTSSPERGARWPAVSLTSRKGASHRGRRAPTPPRRRSMLGRGWNAHRCRPAPVVFVARGSPRSTRWARSRCTRCAGSTSRSARASSSSCSGPRAAASRRCSTSSAGSTCRARARRFWRDHDLARRGRGGS